MMINHSSSQFFYWLYRPAIRWAIIAFAIRLLVCLLLHTLLLDVDTHGLIPNYNDDALYWKVSEELQDGIAPAYLPNSYPMLLAGLFTITGRSVLVGKIFNVVISAITIYFSILTVYELGQSSTLPRSSISSAANWSGCLLTFYPSQIFYSTQLVKDPLLVLMATFCLYFAVLFFQAKRWLALSGLVAALLTLVSFRPYAAIAIGLSLLIYLLFIWRVRLSRKLLLVVMFLLPWAIVPYCLGLGFFAADYVLPWLDWQKLSEFREVSYSSGASAADITLDYSNPILFSLTYGISYLTALLGPFPWQVKSLFQSVALPEALFMTGLMAYLCYLRIFKLLPVSLSAIDLLLISSLLLLGMIALFSDSTGGNTRLRIFSWHSLFLYASLVCSASRVKLRYPAPRLVGHLPR